MPRSTSPSIEESSLALVLSEANTATAQASISYRLYGAMNNRTPGSGIAQLR
jgi:hypothetical protein